MIKISKIVSSIFKNEIALNTLKNSSWLVGDRLITMILGVFVTAIVARYFGPENFGVFNFALSFVTLFTVFSTLGLETLTVKAIVDNEFDEGIILCTSLVLRLCGGLILTIASITLIKFIEPNNSIMFIIVLILSITMIFRSLEVVEYWIQAHQRAKLLSLVRIISYIIVASLKIVMVILGGSIVHYALIHMLNVLLIGGLLLFAYFWIRTDKFIWRFDLIYAKLILSQSWYLILSGLMVTLYMQIDKIMLGSLMSTKFEVGLYSSAIAISSMWYFVPFAVISSFKPVIMRKRVLGEESYKKPIEYLYSIVIWISIFFGLFITLFSTIIVRVLYGADFLGATGVLSVSVWSGTFAIIGSVTSIWLVFKGLQKYNTIFVFSGAVANIVLNMILIPMYGAYGAAIATLLTQIIANIITPLLFKKTRSNVVMIFDALILRSIIKNYILNSN